ncbi:hypothetical protein FG379_002801 [Cryptosporidium bovis]|uniref:uncharacterized protein n=1 Tax=Cryptosporidium bovis TaxID=310047 RepID=UPI00351A212C|nr:hypothetical protein FG379_002801 [Cryptosporidium bovis]
MKLSIFVLNLFGFLQFYKFVESTPITYEGINYSSEDCLLDEGRVCVNTSSVVLNRGMNPGGFLIMECLIKDAGEGFNLDPIIQIQASTPSNYTTLLYNINHDSTEIFDLSWSISQAKETLPDGINFSKNDTVHFAVGIDTNSASTIVVNSKNVLRLGFKGTEHLTKFKSKKSKYCIWKYEMSLTFPKTKTNVKYVPETQDNENNSTESVQVNSTENVLT